MRILVFSQYFPPEIGAAPTRVHAFASGLAARGHEVTVVSEVPNHPQGVIRSDFRGRAIRRLRFDGLEAWYVWVLTAPSKSTATRLSFYVSYAVLAAGLATMLPRPDVIFASSPPPTVGAGAAVAALRHRTPLVFDVRDMWPEFPLAIGELRNPRVAGAIASLSNNLYERARAVTTVTQSFAAAIRARVSDPSKVHLVPNGTTRLWLDAAEVEVDRAALGLRGDAFVWTFAGNLGRGQGLETALEAAAALGHGFQLLLLGDGAVRGELEAQAAHLPTGLVEFRGQVPPQEAARYLRASDALLVSLAPDPALAHFIPSKLYDFSAVGRPVVVAAAGEPTRLVESAESGLAVPPGDPQALARAISVLRDDVDLRTRLSDAGRRLGAASLRERQVARLERILDGSAA